MPSEFQFKEAPLPLEFREAVRGMVRIFSGITHSYIMFFITDNASRFTSCVPRNVSNMFQLSFVFRTIKLFHKAEMHLSEIFLNKKIDVKVTR